MGLIILAIIVCIIILIAIYLACRKYGNARVLSLFGIVISVIFTLYVILSQLKNICYQTMSFLFGYGTYAFIAFLIVLVGIVIGITVISCKSGYKFKESILVGAISLPIICFVIYITSTLISYITYIFHLT